MYTIGETISRVKNTVKAVKEDAFLTDRFVYSVILKYAKAYIRRQDNENKIMKFQSLFEPLPCVDLIEVDKIEACCTNIKTGCTFMRTKEKLPQVLEGVFGPLFRSVTSIDGSVELRRTYPTTFTSMANLPTFKYNTNKYYWFQDGYLYFPNIPWESIRVEGLWEDDISIFKCDAKECQLRQDNPTHIPDYLFAEIEGMVLKDLGLMLQIPLERGDDSQNQLR
jgi:hypothetical protein